MLVILVAIALCLTVSGQMVDPQYMVQHSFASGPKLPFWNMQGDAFAKEDVVRLTPDRQSRRGAIWNTERAVLRNFEVKFSVRIHGSGSLGADGMAFWFTESPSDTGSLFGAQELFRGIGIVLDTYDNDKTGKHPYLSFLVNRGDQHFTHDHDTDAAQGAAGMEQGGCQMPIRNLNAPTLFTLSVRNTQTKLTWVNAEGVEEICMERPIPSIHQILGNGGYFGFSAATGDLADNHDVHSFAVKNLDLDATRTPITFSHEQYLMLGAFSKVDSYMSMQGLGENGESQNDLRALREAVETIKRDNGAQRVVVQNIQKDLGAVKTAIQAQENKANINNDYQNTAVSDEEGGSWGWWFAFFELVVIIVLGFLYNQQVQQKRQKHF